MKNTFNANGIKTKVSILALMVVLATAAVIVFQLKWLETGYETAKEQIKIDGDRILNQAFLEQRRLVSDTIKMLLKKVVKSENDFVYRLDTIGTEENFIFYNNSLPNSNSYCRYSITDEELKLATTNPFQFFWQKVNKMNFIELNGVCSRLILSSDFNFLEGSEKDKIQAQISNYYNGSTIDTKTLHRLVKKATDKIYPDLRFSVGMLTQTTGAYQNKRANGSTIVLAEIATARKELVNKTTGANQNKRASELVDEMEIATEESMKGYGTLKFGDKIDSVNTFVKRMNKKGKSIFVAKPIFDFTTYENLGDIPIIFLIINVPTSYLIGKMLTSVISSAILLLLIGSSLTYMIYLIIKQKKLADLKNDFINNMSHELKTPVATALAAIQGLQYFEVLKDENKTKTYLNTAANEMKRLSIMISSILNSAVFESGDFTLNPSQFNLSAMLNEIIENQQQHAAKAVVISIDYQIGDEIMGDPTHLYSVFINLIDNAIKYSNHNNVEIKIAVVKEENGIKISVIDNGKGIPRAYHAQIFDQFFRVPNQNDHSIKGHGLGLSYVKSIITKHGGEINLTNSSSTGSTFEIYLPQ